MKSVNEHGRVDSDVSCFSFTDLKRYPEEVGDFGRYGGKMVLRFFITNRVERDVTVDGGGREPSGFGTPSYTIHFPWSPLRLWGSSELQVSSNPPSQ